MTMHSKQAVGYGLVWVTVWLFAMTATVATAANMTWTGAAGDWVFTNAVNWSPQRLPLGDDYSDTLIFGGAYTPGTIVLGKLTLYGGPVESQCPGIQFNTAGWTLSNSGGVNYQKCATISSAGSGTNTMSKGPKPKNATTWTVAPGNTLCFPGGLYGEGVYITLKGGGCLRSGVSLTGYGNTGWGMRITNATLRIDAANPYDLTCGGAAHLADPLAKLQLKTTVSGATAQIGGRVVDDTGRGLAVTDIGGGYAEVTVKPLPPKGTVVYLR